MPVAQACAIVLYDWGGSCTDSHVECMFRTGSGGPMSRCNLIELIHCGPANDRKYSSHD